MEKGHLQLLKHFVLVHFRWTTDVLLDVWWLDSVSFKQIFYQSLEKVMRFTEMLIVWFYADIKQKNKTRWLVQYIHNQGQTGFKDIQRIIFSS